jgi:DNA polymerase-3 subunit epsilon
MYAIVDIETTGGYAENHRITELAIIQHDGKVITGRYHTLINPERKIPQFITGLTGITTEMIREAPIFEEVAEEIYQHLESRVFVAHNAHFDFSFLKKEFEQVGISWNPKKLCTVRLSRKIIPGLNSYSLGRLAESVGIKIKDRHRAGGDAHATALIFDLLLKRDVRGVIQKSLKRNSGETILPPNLPKGEFDKLPARVGVYYFHDAKGNVIYVGKAINIKRRIAGHFSGEAREWSRSNIRNEIHHISFELTGSELIALILESQEIRRLWPKYNLAQKLKSDEWGVFSYEDRDGHLRFVVNTVGRGTQPLITFRSKADAWSFLWDKVKSFELCPKLSGLQVAKGLCFSYQSGVCRGACERVESNRSYNERVQKAIDSFTENAESLAIVGQGRRHEEKSLVLVEDGNYIGYGFVGHDITLSTLDAAKMFVSSSKHNRVVQNLIHSYLMNPRGYQVISFTEKNRSL